MVEGYSKINRDSIKRVAPHITSGSISYTLEVTLCEKKLGNSALEAFERFIKSYKFVIYLHTMSYDDGQVVHTIAATCHSYLNHVAFISDLDEFKKHHRFLECDLRQQLQMIREVFQTSYICTSDWDYGRFATNCKECHTPLVEVANDYGELYYCTHCSEFCTNIEYESLDDVLKELGYAQ